MIKTKIDEISYSYEYPTYSIGFMCSVYGKFDIEKYLDRLVRSLTNSIDYTPSHNKLYIATDTVKNMERVNKVMLNTEANQYLSYEVIVVKPSEMMSIGYMRSSLIKYILGRSETCTLYYFMDADDYVTPMFVGKILDQCLNLAKYNSKEFFPILGLNVIPSEETDLNNYTSILFGRSPVHGSIECAKDLLFQEQLTFALWGYVFTKACFKHFIDLSGSYEDGVFIERCMNDSMLDYEIIYNVGYIHVNDTPTSLMNVKKMSEMDKRSFRAFLAGIVDYYSSNPYGNTLSLLWSQIEYYVKRL